MMENDCKGSFETRPKMGFNRVGLREIHRKILISKEKSIHQGFIVIIADIQRFQVRFLGYVLKVVPQNANGVAYCRNL